VVQPKTTRANSPSDLELLIDIGVDPALESLPMAFYALDNEILGFDALRERHEHATQLLPGAKILLR
jgi:hypothetical protein